MISNFFRLIKWLLRGWPILIAFAICGIHSLLILHFGFQADILNKKIALISQIIGGLLILYTIDSNIGIIKNEHLIDMFINYIKQCPLSNNSNKIEGHRTPTVETFTGKARLTIKREPKTVEEKVEYIQEQIDELKQNITEDKKEINKQINHVHNETKTRVQKLNSMLAGIEKKIKEFSVGGVKIQLFGIILMIYGAVTGYFA